MMTADAERLRAARKMTQPPSHPIRIDDIARAVCDLCRIMPCDLGGRSRHPRIVAARALTYRLARELTLLSFPQIARAIGVPNHSSVVTTIQSIEKALKHRGPWLICANNVSVGAEILADPDADAATILNAARLAVVARVSGMPGIDNRGAIAFLTAYFSDRPKPPAEIM